MAKFRGWKWLERGVNAKDAVVTLVSSSVLGAVWAYVKTNDLLLTLLSFAIVPLASVGLVRGVLAFLRSRRKVEPLLPPKAASAEQAPLVSISPNDLLRLFRKGQTAIESRRLVEPYLAKRIRVPGTVQDVEESKDQERTVYLDLPWPEVRTPDGGKVQRVHGSLISLGFSRDWNERVDVLRPGEPITVLGQLVDIDRDGMGLVGCEIIPNVLPFLAPEDRTTTQPTTQEERASRPRLALTYQDDGSWNKPANMWFVLHNAGDSDAFGVLGQPLEFRNHRIAPSAIENLRPQRWGGETRRIVVDLDRKERPLAPEYNMSLADALEESLRSGMNVLSPEDQDRFENGAVPVEFLLVYRDHANARFRDRFKLRYIWATHRFKEPEFISSEFLGGGNASERK